MNVAGKLMRRILLAGLMAVGLIDARADELDLNNDVQVLDLRRAGTKSTVSVAQPVGRYENVSVLSLAGPYDRDLPQPRFDVTGELLATNSDDYDFLVVFTSFEFPTQGALAFYHPIFNDVSGVGLDSFDHREFYGGSRRLQGYIDMAATSRYSFDQRSPEFHSPLNALAHEIMHRWSVSIDYRDAGGLVRSDLIGQGGAHWSLGVSSDASIMYGARWSEQEVDSWVIAEARQRLGLWDLYLAGLAGIEEMPSIALLRSPDVDPQALPEVGIAATGQQDYILPAQVIAAEGQRQPAFTETQREFNAALVYLVRPGEVPDPAELAKLESFRVAFERYFQAITRGRAVIRIGHIETAEHGVNAPPTTSGSPGPPPTEAIQAATQWLLAAQHSDGHWADRAATASRDTRSAVGLLGDVLGTEQALNAALVWLGERIPANVDERTWLQEALPSRQFSGHSTGNDDGGMGLLVGWLSSPMDSLRTLLAALAALERDDALIADVSGYLLDQQNPDGSFAPTAGGRGRMSQTLVAAAKLLAESNAASQTAGTRARDWLQAQVTIDSITGGDWSLTELAELATHADIIQLDASMRAAVMQRLRASQGGEGDWAGSVYTTSISAAALLRDDRPNLLPLTATIEPSDPIQGEWLDLRLRAANRGGRQAPTSTLRWYDRDPDSAGAVELASVEVPALAAGAETVVESSVLASLAPGQHELHAVLDSANEVVEGREDDNILVYLLTLRPPPVASDLLLDARDMSIAPDSITRIPSTIRIDGLIRNLGQTPVSQVVLRAMHLRNGGELVPLTEVLVDVLAAGEAAFMLDIPIDAPEAYRIRLLVDADDEVTEAREDNNAAELSIPFGNSIDLELPGASLQVSPELPVLGDDLRFRVMVANRGTNDSPAVGLILEQEVAAEWQLRAQTTVSVSAGQEAERELIWRPQAEGTFNLRLSVDPQDLLAETDETNNQHAFQLVLGRSDVPNLVVVPATVITLPAPVLQGAPLSVQAMLRNLGESAAAAFNVALYLGDPRSGGQRLGSVRVDAGLAPQTDLAVQIDVADYAASGDAELFVFVDSELEVEERNESDNLGIRGITALRLPDLATALGAIALTPSSPAFGQPVSADVTISNLGEQPSAAVVAELAELAGVNNAPVMPAISVPALPPGSSFQAQWSWTFGLVDATQALSIKIDPDNQLREFNELNNEVTLLLDTQEGDGFASERFFSPNGDGVRDQTRLIWREATGVQQVSIRDHGGRERRRLSIEGVLGDGSVSAIWDGRDDSGRVVFDGRYTVIGVAGNGQQQQPMHVTVDNDQPMALEAVNSSHGVLREFPSSVRTWTPVPEGSIAEDYVYTAGHPDNPQVALRRGVVRFNVLTGVTEPVLTARWLDDYVDEHSLVELEPVQLMPLADSRLLLAATEYGGANRTLLFLLHADDIDDPLLLATVPTRALLPLLGVADAQRVVVGDANPHEQRWIVDLNNGSLTPLRTNASGGEVLHVSAAGMVLPTSDVQAMEFIPFDAQLPIVRLPLLEQARVVRTSFSDEGLHYLRHVQEEVPGNINGEEIVYLVNVQSGFQQELFRTTVPFLLGPPGNGAASKRRADEKGAWRRLRVLRAFWLEHQREVVIIDHAARRIRRYSSQGDPLGHVDLPPSLRQGDYEESAFGQSAAITDILDAEAASTAWFCDGSAHESWLLRARSTLGFERPLYAADSNSLYLTAGEAVYMADDGTGYHTTDMVCEGAVDYLRVSPEGDSLRLGGSTMWPLSASADRANYPLLQRVNGVAVPPPDWPAFIHRNGTLLRRDGRVDVPSQGRLTAPWPAAHRLRDSSRSHTRVYLAPNTAPPSEQRVTASFSTLDKLTAVLEANSDGRSVALFGVATDRNFDHFAIDWARAADPESWNALIPATREELLFDDFITWAPPEPGAYLFRLRVVDRAGNLRERRASAEVLAGSPIGNLRQDFRHISPNGDGVQDRVVLSFNVVRATEQGFEVRDSVGRVVRRDDLSYGTAELGANSWAWDGRDDAGAPAAEGRYRIELSSGHALRVNLDLTAPVVEASLIRPDQVVEESPKLDIPLTRGPSIEFRVDERFLNLPGPLQQAQIEASPLDAERWRAIEPFRLAAREDGGNGAMLAASDYVGNRFRLVVTDLAGNRVLHQAGSSEPGLRLIHMDLLRQFMPSLQKPPYSSGFAIPDYKWFGRPIPVLISSATPLFALDLTGQIVQLAVDELVPGISGAEPAWEPRSAGPPLPPGPSEPGHLVGHVFRTEIDLAGREPGSYATLRLRARLADGSEQISNAMRFLLGGLLFECPNIFEPARAISFLEEPTSDHFMQFASQLLNDESQMQILGAVAPDRREGRVAYFPGTGTNASVLRAVARDALNRQVTSSWTPCGVPDPVGDSGSLRPWIRAVPAFSAECDAAPSQRVAVFVGLGETTGAHRLRVSSPFLTAPFTQDLSEIGLTEIGVGDWPAGPYSVHLESPAEAGSGWVSLASAPFLVDHDPPVVDIIAPSAGSRICASDVEDNPLRAMVDDEARFGFFFESRSDAEWDGYQLLEAVECLYPSGCESFRTGSVRDFLSDQPIDFSRPLPEDENARTTHLRIRASDWSGGQVCRSTSYRIDDRAQIEERSAPIPQPAPNSRIDFPAISTATTDDNYRTARWFLLTREPVFFDVRLFRGHRVAGKVEPIGAHLAILEEQTGINGELSFLWDGRVAGEPVPDDLYVLRFRAVDDCGNEDHLDRPLLIDSTPPSIDVVHPQAGAPLRAVTVQFVGAIDDPRFGGYTLQLSQASADGPWLLLAEGDRARPAPTVLAQWPTGGALGLLWIRYAAQDWLGNRSELVEQVELLPRELVLQDALLSPTLFSPNDDGRLDVTSVTLQLRLPAVLTVNVLSADGQTLLRRLATAAPAQVGPLVIDWDGRADDGSVLPDGEYIVDIHAVDAALPESVDTQQLTLTLDATAPTLDSVTPQEGVVSCAESASFVVDDPHFDRFEARLRRDAAVVVSGEGSGRGLQIIASLANLVEAAYQLEIEAHDLAGNRSDAMREFVLDCTAPSAELLLPAESAVVPRVEGQPVRITGSAADEHLRHYRLTIAPSDTPQAITVLAESAENVTHGTLLDWAVQHPDGEYQLSLVVEDLAGNRSDVVRRLIIDGTPPVASITVPTAGSEVRQTLQIQGAASDQNFGHYRVQFATPELAAADQWSTIVESEVAVQGGVLADLQLVNEGPLEVRLVVEDLAGLQTQAQVALIVDGQPPPPPQNLSAVVESNLNVRLTWQGSDVPDLDSFQILRNGGELARTSMRSHLDQQVPEAELTYVVIAEDRAGNRSAPSNAVTVRVDRTPPEVALFAPTAAERIRGLYAVRGVAHSESDFASYRLSLRRPDGSTLGELRTSSSPISGGVLHTWDTRGIDSETSLRLRLSALDTSGNQAQAEVQVVVDNEPPAAPTGLQANEAGDDLLVTWDANTEPDLLGYLLYRRGQLIGHGGSLPGDLRPLAMPENLYADADAPDGALTYRVYAIDQSGNISAPSAPAELVRDAGPPSLRIVRPQSDEEFSIAVEVLAESDDSDIASVVFASRMAGSSAWVGFGQVQTQPPWRSTFEPGELAYGDYELRATATDQGGLVDPEPPVVAVRHVDLIPPAAPATPTARADGETVTVNWPANTEADLAGYRVERQAADGQWLPLQEELLQASSVMDEQRPLGPHHYRVLAEDSSGNRSPASASDTAHVFDLSLEQPYTPVAEATIVVIGSAHARGGVLRYRVEGESSSEDGEGSAVLAGQGFALHDLPLPVGSNYIQVRIADAEGNVSLPSEVAVQRGERPLPPFDLLGVISGLDVALSWQPSPTADVAGYRVYRNEGPIASDQALAQPIEAYVSNDDAPEVVDGDPATGWGIGSPPDSAVLGQDAWIELWWNDVAHIAGLQIDYADAASAAGAYRVLAWDDGAGWIALGERSGGQDASELMLFPSVYPTYGLRIELLRSRQPGANVALQELLVLERAPLAELATVDRVIEGRHAYTVSAISPLGFESERSSPWIAEVGDAEAPPSVQLNGAIENGSPVLEWTASEAPDLHSYVLFRDGESVALIDAAAPRRHVDSGLANGDYTYSVMAQDATFNQSPRSNEVTLEVANDVPDAPTITLVDQPGEALSLRVVWTAGTGTAPIGYQLFVAAQAEGPYDSLLSLEASEYLHLGLSVGRGYFYRVAAFDSSGNQSALSDPAGGVVVERTPPLTPHLTYPTLPGAPRIWTAPRFDVCGITSAAASVTVTIEGEAATVIEANAAAFIDSLEMAAFGSEAMVSADGRSVLIGRDQLGASGWFDIESGERISAPEPGAGSWRFLRRLPDGASVLSADLVGRIFVSSPSETTLRAQFSGAMQDLAAGPDAEHLFVLGNYFFQGLGLWIRSGSEQAFSRIELPGGLPPRANSLHWREADRSLLLADSAGRVYRVDPTTREAMQIGDGAVRAGPLPAPVGDAWLMLGADGDLLRVDADGQPPRQLFVDERTPLAAAWSPDAQRVALRYEDSLEVFDADSGTRISADWADGFNAHAVPRLDWAPSWTLLISSSTMHAERAEVAGAFCARDLITRPGLQTIQAVARKGSTLLSGVSEPIKLDHPTDAGSEFDLALRAEDVRLFPQAGRLGDQLVVYASLRNLGSATISLPGGRLVSARLQGPSSSIDLPVQTSAQTLAPGSSSTVTVDLGRLLIGGDYNLELMADPDSLLNEIDEGNNRAQRTWHFGDVSTPQLSISAERYSWAPGQTIRGVVDASNDGPLFDGEILLRAAAEDGTDLGEVQRFAVPALGTGQARSFDWQWVPGQLAHGPHSVTATLRNANGVDLLGRAQPVNIEALAELDLLLLPASSVHPVGSPLPIQVGIDYLSGNQLLVEGRLVLLARMEDGSELPLWQGDTGLLLPGYSIRQTVVWPAASLQAGNHELELRFVDGDIERSVIREVQVNDGAVVAALRGDLRLDPQPNLVLGGQPLTLQASLRNEGGAALQAVQARLQVREEGQTTAVLEQLWSLDLGVGADATQTLPLAGLPEQLQRYVAHLQARLPGDAPGSWRSLASLGFAAVDGLPPQISIIAPDNLEPHRPPAPLAARINDQHSRVEQAWHRVDGGEWRLLSAGGISGYDALLHGLADGVHVVDLRAQDLWGNEATLVGHTFTVDSTPPSIAISGVQDGDLYNQPVVPVISVEDLHPGETNIRLNDLDYASGTPVTEDGGHRLRVVAEDRAGNRAERQLQFSIDSVAPTISFVSPVDGAQTAEAAVHVSLATEPAARVDFSAGAFTAQTVADAAGHALIADVPIMMGSNLLQATATDQAQNQSAVASIEVIREPLTGVLGGQIIAALAALPQGQSLPLQIEVNNGSGQALDPVAARLRAVDANGAELFVDVRSLSLAAGASEAWDAEVGAENWDFGVVTLHLDADAGQGFELLDEISIEVVDVLPPQLQVQAPAAGSVQPRPTALSVGIVDDRGVSSAEYRIDDAQWQPLSVVAEDQYGAEVSLADGAHLASFRAADAAGNVGQSTALDFVVDGTAPQINIAGVAEGALYAEAVAADVQVVDAHPSLLEIRLNDSPYVSGTSIAASGQYVLDVVAEDVVGNRSERRLGFTVDLDPPEVVFVEPAADAIIAADRIVVVGTTEASASVRLSTAGFEAVVSANAQGGFGVANVPLQPGENLIRAEATDLAGNIGGESTLRVFHSPGNPIGLGGSIVASPPNVALGATFLLKFEIRELAGLARDPLQARILIRAVGTVDPVQVVTRTFSLPPGQTVVDSELVATQLMALGEYLAVLEVDVEGTWRELASAAVSILDLSAPELSFVAPVQGSLQGSQVDVRVHASDVGGVESVQLRVEGAGWHPMAAVSEVEWQLLLQLPWEGAVRIEARATDAAGNQSLPIAVSVISDQSAPMIVVVGVANGLHSTVAVRPLISIEDASEFSSEITLNGQPFASGTAIGGQGDHVLLIVAEDVLGNRSSREIAFSVYVAPFYIPALRLEFALLGALALLLGAMRRLGGRRSRP
jgi:subtilase family serine protease/flagellar hook assembly protein FlgD